MGISREKVLALADAETVAYGLGYQLGQRSRKHIQMLCPYPDHDDHKMGNCYLYTETKGFHCFACNRSGTIIDLVMLHEGWGLDDKKKSYEAMEKIATLCGLSEDSVSDGRGFEKRIVPPTLTKAQEELLGLYNSPVYNVSNIEVDEFTGDYEEVKSMVMSSPLTALRLEDPDTYCELVLNHARDKRASILERQKSVAVSLLDKNADAMSKALYWIMYNEYMESIQAIDEIVLGILEYISKTKKQKEKRRSKYAKHGKWKK